MNAALKAIFGPVAVEDSSEGLNDKCVCNEEPGAPIQLLTRIKIKRSRAFEGTI